MDRIKELAFTVKNVSDREITFFRIDLVIKRNDKLPVEIRIPVEFGRGEPVLDATGTPTGEYKREPMKPGDSVRVKVSQEKFDIWSKRLKEFGADDVDPGLGGS